MRVKTCVCTCICRLLRESALKSVACGRETLASRLCDLTFGKFVKTEPQSYAEKKPDIEYDSIGDTRKSSCCLEGSDPATNALRASKVTKAREAKFVRGQGVQQTSKQPTSCLFLSRLHRLELILPLRFTASL
jgi:hypothetical protein